MLIDYCPNVCFPEKLNLYQYLILRKTWLIASSVNLTGFLDEQIQGRKWHKLGPLSFVDTEIVWGTMSTMSSAGIGPLFIAAIVRAAIYT